MCGLACRASVAVLVLGSIDASAVITVPKVERFACLDERLASPASDDASRYTLSPLLTLRLVVLAVASLCWRASLGFVLCPVWFAVAALCNGGTARLTAYAASPSHQAARSRLLCVNSSLRLATTARSASAMVAK